MVCVSDPAQDQQKICGNLAYLMSKLGMLQLGKTNWQLKRGWLKRVLCYNRYVLAMDNYE